MDIACSQGLIALWRCAECTYSACAAAASHSYRSKLHAVPLHGHFGKQEQPLL